MLELTRDRFQIRASLRDRRAWFEPANDADDMRAALRKRIWPEPLQRHDKIARLPIGRKLPAVGHHPQNRKRSRTHRDLAAEDVRIARKRALPQLVTDHHDIRRAGFRFLRRESATEHWRDTEGCEEIAIDRDAIQFLRFTHAGQHRPCAAVGRDRAEAAALRAEIEHVRQRPGFARIRIVRRRAPDIHELLGMWKRQRAQEHGIDDAEDGAVRPNPECERENGDGSETGRLEQHPEGVFEVSDHKMKSEVRNPKSESMTE